MAASLIMKKKGMVKSMIRRPISLDVVCYNIANLYRVDLIDGGVANHEKGKNDEIHVTVAQSPSM
jgi:hypothetical protein